MVLISAKELNKFLHHSSKIKTSSLLAQLSYVKLECKEGKATLTKTNLSQFVVCDIEADFKKDITVLLDEKTLAAAVKDSATPEIKISIKGQNVLLNDGETEYKHQISDHSTFPHPLLPTNEKSHVLSSDDVYYMKIASLHTQSPDKGLGWKNNIHFKKMNGKKYMIASDGFVLFSKETEYDGDDVSFSPEVVPFIEGAKTGIELIQTEKYNYFKTGESIFGFIVEEYKAGDISPVINQALEAPMFKIDKNELSKFLNKAASLGSGVESVVFENRDNGISLTFSDIAQDRGMSKEIGVEGKDYELEKTNILPRQLLTTLRGVSSNEVMLGKRGTFIVVKPVDDNTQTGIVQQVSSLN